MAQNSVHISGGALQGAYLPSSTTIPSENLQGKRTRKFLVEVPPQKAKNRVGNSALVSINGRTHRVEIPKGKLPGDKFPYEIHEYYIEKIIASTLPTVPGMEIVQAKPIVYGSVSRAFYAGSYNQQSMGALVGSLLQKAQEEILKQVIDADCNACLGMTFNVTNDSSGEHGNNKVVIVTACGTPCVVLPLVVQHPEIIADAIVEPLYFGER